MAGLLGQKPLPYRLAIDLQRLFTHKTFKTVLEKKLNVGKYRCKNCNFLFPFKGQICTRFYPDWEYVWV